MAQSIVRMNPPTLSNAAERGHAQISILEPGRMAYISGQVAWGPEGPGDKPVPEALAEQMDMVATNIGAALDAVGATSQDIAIVRFYMVDITDERVGQIIPGLMAVLDGALPSFTFIGVASLFAPELQIEMEIVVRVPD